MRNHGHGHVVPRPDGVQARCGGPALCSVCAKEAAQQQPETLRQREGDQPLPVPNDRQDVQSLVMADLTARRAVGIQRYGTALQAFNGRDALRDLYEELLDACCYIRQVIEERS